jgi:polar amino acid transport system substrate-binding protein
MAEALAASMHKKLKIENIPFEGLITALKSGKIDLIIASMTVKPERQQSIDFSDPYITTGLGILANVNSNITSVKDLSRPGIKIVTKSGTTGHDYVEAHLPKAIKTVLPDEANCALEVSQGKADAFVYDQFAIYRHQKKYPNTTIAILDPFEKENWAIGIRKGNDQLRKQVNAFIAEFRASHQLETLAEKYLKAERKDFDKMDSPFSFREEIQMDQLRETRVHAMPSIQNFGSRLQRMA